jgi:hypothetical protein
MASKAELLMLKEKVKEQSEIVGALLDATIESPILDKIIELDKTLYFRYMDAGFSADQAFELLKMFKQNGNMPNLNSMGQHQGGC